MSTPTPRSAQPDWWLLWYHWDKLNFANILTAWGEIVSANGSQASTSQYSSGFRPHWLAFAAVIFPTRKVSEQAFKSFDSILALDLGPRSWPSILALVIAFTSAVVGTAIVILLAGGKKRRQQADIATAQALWQEFKGRKQED